MVDIDASCPGLERWAFAVSCSVGLGLAVAMPVFAQEAYYWSYAQHPALSYFDHPPMAAWLIWIGTRMFGDGALGLRFGTWICSCATAWLGLVWLRSLGVSPRGRVAFLVCTFGVPLVGVARFLTTPDPPLLCFWTATMVALWRARAGSLRWWAAAGAAAGCALLSKYSAGFLALGGLSVLLLDPLMRRQWRRPGPYLGVLVSIVVFSPVVLWNLGNDFESFRFQTGRFGHAAIGTHWLFQFLGGQLLVLHPVLFALLPGLLWWLLGAARGRDIGALWSLAFGVPIVAFFASSSLVIQVKINWLLPAFVPLMGAGIMWWEAREATLARRRPRLWAWAQRSVLGMAILFVVGAPLVRWLPQVGGSSWSGWDQIASRAEHWRSDLDREDDRDGNVFFFAPNYRDAAQLLRELELRREVTPESMRLPRQPVLAQNTLGEPALQFDHWETPQRHAGESAVFVQSSPEREPERARRIFGYFASVQRVETVRVRRFGVVVASADIYACRGYLGPDPK